MLRELHRSLSLGKPVEIIYLDRQGHITQRRIQLHAIEGDRVRAFCFTRRAIRSFAVSNILAVAAVTFMRGA